MYYKEYGNPDGQLVVYIHGGFTTVDYGYLKGTSSMDGNI